MLPYVVEAREAHSSTLMARQGRVPSRDPCQQSIVSSSTLQLQKRLTKGATRTQTIYRGTDIPEYFYYANSKRDFLLESKNIGSCELAFRKVKSGQIR